MRRGEQCGNPTRGGSSADESSLAKIISPVINELQRAEAQLIAREADYQQQATEHRQQEQQSAAKLALLEEEALHARSKLQKQINELETSLRLLRQKRQEQEDVVAPTAVGAWSRPRGA